MIEHVEIGCPWCGESYSYALDCSAGCAGSVVEFVEDCQVCCQPIVFQLTTDPGSGAIALATERENG